VRFAVRSWLKVTANSLLPTAYKSRQ